MDVLFVTHAFPRSADDAAGSFILRLAVALERENVRVTVVAPHARGLASVDTISGVTVRRVRYAPGPFETLAYTGTMAEQVRSSWFARLALVGLLTATTVATARRVRTLRPQLVHAHWWFPSGLCAALTRRRTPLVTTLHGSDVRLARTVPGASTMYGAVARRSAVVTAVSSWLASEAATLAPQNTVPRVEPMPVDVDLFTPSGTRDHDRLLFVGRLTPQKGVAHLLHALVTLPPGVTLDVVGSGPEADRLRALAGSLGVGSRVRWLGMLGQRSVVSLYQTATALVVPSVDEGLGLVAVEAQLCETPVIAFDSGGLRDVVIDDETGVLVQAGNAAALSDAIRGLLLNSDRRTSLGKSARRRAIARFSPPIVARRYAALYQEALDHSPNRSR